MARKLFAIISLFFTLVCCTSCTYYVIQKKDDVKPDMVQEEMPIPSKIQYEVAIHEAGHAIAMELLLGPGTVGEVVVGTVHDSDLPRGFCSFEPTVRRYDAETLRNLAVIYLIGRAADDIINGHPVSGSATDLSYASDRLYHLHFKYGLGDTLLSYPDDYVTEEMLKVVEEDLVDYYGLAEEIVLANTSVITELAKALMKIEESGDKRTMTGEEFRKFLKKHKLVDPRKTE